MNINKVIESASQVAAKTTVEELRRKNYLSGAVKRPKGKTAFQKTEALLRSYNELKAAIIDKKHYIEDIKKNGILKGKRSNSMPSGTSTVKYEAEIVEERINALERNMLVTEYFVRMIDELLDSIKDDPYADVIRMKYFEKLPSEEVAERLFVDVSTINRNKRRIIDMLKVRLFSEEYMCELAGF